MIKKVLFLLLFCAGLSYATAYTASQSGNWGTAATWGGAGVPGNNDTALIPSFVVTSTFSVTVGTSPAGGTPSSVGTYAVKLTGTGQLVIATGTLTARGDIEVNGTGNVTLQPGTTLQLDSSLASSPISQHYRINGTNFNSYDILISSCTAAKRCQVVSNASGGNGYIDDGAQAVTSYGGGIYASYTDFERIGDSTHYFTNIWTTGTGNDWNVQHCTFDSCGLIEMPNGVPGTQVFIHKNNIHTNSLDDTPLELSMTNANTSGTREIGFNTFDKIVGIHATNLASARDFSVHDNYFGDGWTGTVSSGGGPMALFTNNIARYSNATYSFQANGPLINNAFILDDYHVVHLHEPDFPDNVTGIQISSNVFDTTMVQQDISAEVDDGLCDTVGATAISTWTVTYNVETCGSRPNVGQNFWTATKVTSNTWVMDHNTACAGQGWAGSFQENYDGPRFMKRGSITNNIWFNQVPNLSYAFFMYPSTAGWTDVYDPTKIKTNVSTNIITAISDPNAPNAAHGYFGAFSSTPGATDFVADPQFIDTTRHYVTFDAAYLVPKGLAASPSASWSLGGTFTAGQIVSDSSSTFYGGTTINYRCLVSTANAQATIRPAVGSNFHQYWEFATAYDVRNAINNGLTITDSSLSLTNATYIQTLIAWEKAGYQPQNAALHSAGYDGTDIGAEPFAGAAPTLKLSKFWISDGGYKQPLEDLLPTDVNNAFVGSCATCTISRNWDGTTAKTFALKNETVSLVLYMADTTTFNATNVSVQISTLTGTDGTKIPMVSVSSITVWDTSTRPIQEFYVRYLKILGLSVDYDGLHEQRFIPHSFQVPCTVNGSGQCGPNVGTTWPNRPNANKSIPDILVPYEVVAASSFTVAASSSQAIWFDIYVSSTLPAQTYTGTITVMEDVNVSTTIPVSLLVYNATLPQIPAARSVGYIEGQGIYQRQYNDGSCVTSSCIKTMDHYVQLLKAHGFDPIGDNDTATDAPTAQYTNYLNGSVFVSNGYGNARGYGIGIQNYSIGTYGNWANFWSTSSVTNFCGHVAGWDTYFKTNYPNVRSWVYLADEPTNLVTSGVAQWSEWMSTVTACQVSGYFVNSFVTNDLPTIVSTAPFITQPTSTGSMGVSSATWQTDAAAYTSNGSTQVWRYNAGGPGLDDALVLEEDGIGPRQDYWSFWKKGVKGYFDWQTVGWGNSFTLPVSTTDVFNVALTFGVSTSSDNLIGNTGGGYTNGNGVLIYPGTDIVTGYKNYGIDGGIPSWRLKMLRRGIQDYDYLTLANADNSTATNTLVQSMAPKVIWDYQCFDPSSQANCSFAYGARSWPADAGSWETARESLAQIIQAGPPINLSIQGNAPLTGSAILQ